jgi:cobalt-zinc-cadmium efflux system outer membrane protein
MSAMRSLSFMTNYRTQLALVAQVICLAGCASYIPLPFPVARDVLAKPDLAILSADALRIQRPYLTAQSIDLFAPLTPNALAVIAVLENPDLKAQRAKLGIVDAQAFAARLLPDPTFQASFDKLLSGPDLFNGLGAQLGIDLNQLRTARVARQSGEASKRRVRLDIAWAEWQTAGQARLQGVRVLALSQQARIAGASAASAQNLFDASSRAAGRGDIGATDLDIRRQSLLDATTKARAAASDLATALADLNKLLGLPSTMDLALASVAPPPMPPSAEILTAQALERRLDLQALRAGYGVAEADLHKAVLDQFPNLSLTAVFARDTANNRTLGPQVNFSLPLWNRNRGGIAIARATREQLKAEYGARLFQTRSEIEAAVARVMFLRKQKTELGAQMPAIEKYASATARAAKRGDLSRATADTALQALRDRELTLLQIDQQIAEQTIALELLSGGPAEGWTR